MSVKVGSQDDLKAILLGVDLVRSENYCRSTRFTGVIYFSFYGETRAITDIRRKTSELGRRQVVETQAVTQDDPISRDTGEQLAGGGETSNALVLLYRLWVYRRLPTQVFAEA